MTLIGQAVIAVLMFFLSFWLFAANAWLGGTVTLLAGVFCAINIAKIIKEGGEA